MSEKARSELAVLAALAWADGQVSPEEAAQLRRLAEEVELTSQEASELESLLATPVPLDRFEALVGELRRTHPTVEDRRTMLERAARMVRADGRIDPEEERRLAVLRTLLEPGGEGSFFGRVRAFVRGTRTAEAVRSSHAAATLSREEEERLQIGGMLVGRILVPGTASGSAVVPPVILQQAGYSAGEAGAMLAGMQRIGGREVDRQRLCAEFNRLSGEADRLRLLRGLFVLVRSQGGLSAAAEQEIRLISNYLWIDAEEFHRVRLETAGGRA
jgi:tellurite resistance protein